MDKDFEETDIVKILQVFGSFRNSLPKEHSDFVRAQLQKDYDIVTKTYLLGGTEYTGTFREDAHRKNNKEAYEKESKLAIVLASFGFDVILIEENNALPGKKPDAIVNGIVMDFKEITARSEKDASKNTLGNNYQNGIHKKFSQGVAIYLHNFSNDFVKTHMSGEKTSPTHNGLALFFHEDTGTFQLIDIQKVRAAYIKQLQGIAPAVSSEPHQMNNNSQNIEKSSEKVLKHKKLTKSKERDFGVRR